MSSKRQLEQVDMQTVPTGRKSFWLKDSNGLNAADYTNIILYYSVTNMGAEEIFFDSTGWSNHKVAEVVQAIEARLAASKEKFCRGYGIEQMELLDNSIINVQGNFILFVVNPNAKEIDQAFRDSL